MFGCAEEEVGLADKLETRLVAYDEMNVERTSFSPGEDITLSLVLVNTSSQNVEAGTYFDYCSIYEQDEFLLLYRLTVSDTGVESWEPVGKPYAPPVYCATVALPVVVVANGEQIVCGFRWSNNPGNPPLGPGRYYTSLSHVEEIAGQVLDMDLRLDFEIQ
jgi:hypothetical protein